MTLLYAVGLGAMVNVAVAILGRLLRLANVRLDPSGESIVVGVAAAAIVVTLGLGARRELVRIALLGLAAHGALLINRVLGVAFTGRTPVDGSADAFLFTPVALELLAVGLVLGIAIGLIVRGFQPRIPWRPPERIVRAAGFVFVVGTIAGVGRLSDPRFDPVAGQLRGTIALSWFLVAMRLAGWPLGATFAQGFLAPERPTRAEQAR